MGHLSRKIKILFENRDFTAFHDPKFHWKDFVQVGMEKKWRRLIVSSKWVQVWRYSEKGISKLKNDIKFMYVGFTIGKIWPVENGKKIAIFFELFFCGRPGYIRDVSVETVWAIPDISGIGPLREEWNSVLFEDRFVKFRRDKLFEQCAHSPLEA